MATDRQMTLLRVDLGLMRLTDDQKTYFGALLDTAASAIARRGVTLAADSLEDDTIISMWAAWLYRKRKSETDTPMPRMLMVAVNDKLAAQKMAVTNNDL